MMKTDNMVMTLSVIAFILSVTAFVAEIFAKNDVSTLGASASIMVLVNVQCWTIMTEQINQQRQKDNEISDPRKRAKNFVSQLDLVIEFASNLMNQIQANADNDGELADAQKIEAEREWEEQKQRYAKYLQYIPPSPDVTGMISVNHTNTENLFKKYYVLEKKTVGILYSSLHMKILKENFNIVKLEDDAPVQL